MPCSRPYKFHERPDDLVAGVTGLEPAASGVTGRRSNRLSYTPVQGRSVPLRRGALDTRPLGASQATCHLHSHGNAASNPPSREKNPSVLASVRTRQFAGSPERPRRSIRVVPRVN